MASTAISLHLTKPKFKPFLRFHRFSSSSSSSSSSTPPPPHSPDDPQSQSQSQSQSSFSSYFTDVKASLKQSPPPPQTNPTRKPFSFSNQTQNPNPPTNMASLEEIRKNLSEFRRRSSVDDKPSSPPSSSRHVSFQELYKRNVLPKPEHSNPNPGAKPSLDSIRESLRQLRLKNQDSTPLTQPHSPFQGGFRINPQPDPNKSPPGNVMVPTSVFAKDMVRDKKETEASKTEFVKMYSYQELGEKLRKLRPEKNVREKNGFSLGELNERLMKLREIEEKENELRVGGVSFSDLRASLLKLQSDEKAKKSTLVQRIDVLGQLGGTPGFMLAPPKEPLVEKYFHPDNLSSSEKMKLELKKVRDEFKMSESDCGSARVQVAQLTTKIKHLSTALHKKDKHSRKGLVGMVQRRKKLLKYLRRTDWDSYCLVLSKFGLRDNPVYKN